MYKILVAIFLLFTIPAGAQQLSNHNRHELEILQDSMKFYAHDMIFGILGPDRFHADSLFIRLLVRALKIPYSYEFPFDSIQTVSILYPPDKSFRIFTWELERDESYFRQYGAIQMNTANGSLKLFPLFDASDFSQVPTDSVRTNLNWIGAIYYGMVMKTFQDRKYYTLLGFDDNDFSTTKKWIEVLTFDAKGNPEFGGHFFSYPNDSIKPQQPVDRFCLEYKKDARTRMDYDPDMDMIIFDHLISETNHQNEKYTLIPDGDYEGFKWEGGKWVLVSKVFDQKLQNGQEPVPAPILNDKGLPDEKKLMEQSEKNMKKDDTPPQP